MTIEYSPLKITTIEEGLKFWTDIIGVNVAPWDTKNKAPMLGKGEYEPWQTKPIPNATMQHWLRNNLFSKGFQIYLGKLHHAYGDLKNYYLTCIDLDNEAAIKEFCNINGEQYTLEELSELGFLVEQHGDPDTAHVYFITKEQLKKKGSTNKPISGELNQNIPKIEVKSDGTCRVSATPSYHEDGTPYHFVGNYQKFVNNLVFHNKDTIEQHVDKICKKYNIDYHNDNSTNKNYNPVERNKTPIRKGERHNKVLSYALSLILKNYKTTNRDTIYNYLVVFNNDPKEIEEPLPEPELRQIFNDSWKKAEEIIRNNNSQQEEINTNGRIFSVLEAKRLHTGEVTVGGTIVSVSDLYVLELENDGVIKHRNAKSIQLEDSEKLDENERLDVVLYDDMVDNVVAGETVQISGTISIEDKKANSKSKKKYNVLHAKSIIYLNRKEVLVTNKDIQTFERFASYPQLLDRLAKMFAPHIIGHDEVKRGLLRSIVGGVNRGKKSDGRISTLEVGDPGTAKSKLGAEATEIKPNSRHVSAPHSTTKTITAIVEKVNDSISLSLGAIPLSKGAICAIDEINSFSMEDQSRLLDVLEEGKINLDKMGRRYTIPAATTIIATANPVGGKWNSNQVATKEEIELKRSLMDRFPQIYTFRDDMDENQTHDFVEEMSAIRRRKSHNYEFLRKYLIHASSIKDVVFTKTAEQKLDEFWAKAKVKGLLSFRMYNGLFKIAEAQAKLQLKNIVDDEIVNQVIEDVQLMMMQYGETVEQFIGPHELTLNTILEVLKDNHPSSMTLESICQLAIHKNDRIASYMGYVWTTRSNWKLRSVVDSLLNRRDVIRVQEKPFVLQFLCDGCDACEGKNKNTSEDDDKKDERERSNKENITYETASHTSHTSHRNNFVERREDKI